MIDDPWAHVVKIVLESGTSTGRLYVKSLITDNVDDVFQGKDAIKLSISNSVSSRRMIYKNLNLDLIVDRTYCERNSKREVHRIAYSQFRVSEH